MRATTPLARPRPAFDLSRMWMRRTLWLILVACTAGCGDGPGTPTDPGLSPERFTRVFGDLVVARIELLPDTIAYQESRREILENAGLTPEDLERFVARHGSDSDRMSAIYGRVRARIDSVISARARRDTRAATPLLRDSISGR